MAEEKGVRKKRLVKNPETFRERALKATEESDKPTKRGRVRQAGAKVTTPLAKPFTAVFKFLGRYRAFRFLSRVFVPHYLRTSLVELKQVKWPNWEQSRRLTVAVLIFAALFGVTIAVVDYGLDKLFRNVLLK